MSALISTKSFLTSQNHACNQNNKQPISVTEMYGKTINTEISTKLRGQIFSRAN